MERHFSTNSRIVKDIFAQYQNTFSAFCELINNSIQASCKNIYIDIDYVQLNEVYHTILKKITITDDGCGVSLSEVDEKLFNIGTNAKKGGQGIGRFSALQLGRKFVIETVGFDEKANKYTKLSVPLTLTKFYTGEKLNNIVADTVEEVFDTKKETYYKVIIDEIYEQAFWKNHPEVKFTFHFLPENLERLIFERYSLLIYDKKIKFHINGKPLNPIYYVDGEPISLSEKFRLPNGDEYVIDFDFVKLKTSNSKIQVFLNVDNAGIKTIGGSFDYDTNWLSPNIGNWFVYVFSDLFNVDFLRNAQLGDFDENSKKLKKFIKEVLNNFYKNRNKKYEEFTTELKKDSNYPYNKKEASSKSKAIVFDKLAYIIEEKHSLLESKNSIREIVYPLIDQSISNGQFRNIIKHMMKLDDTTLSKFDSLLEKVELEDMIVFSEKVARKMEDLCLLEEIVYGKVSKHILERKQLHKIVEHMLWLFGEQYADSTRLLSDKKLEHNLKELRDKFLVYSPDEDEDNIAQIESDEINSITDLFLYSEKILDESSREVIIVELKAPKVKISTKELAQAEKYAFQIESKGNFPPRITFKILLVGAELNGIVKSKIKGIEKQTGIPYFLWSNESKNIEIYVVEWSDIIERTKRKLNYLSSELKVKDISIEEKIKKDFAEIDLEEVKSRLRKTALETVDEI